MHTELERLRAEADQLREENRRLTRHNASMTTALSSIVGMTHTYSGITAPGICVGVFQTACAALTATGARVSFTTTRG